MKISTQPLCLILSLFLTFKTTAQPAWTWQKAVGKTYNVETISRIIANRDGKIVAVGNVLDKKQGVYFSIYDPLKGTILRETMVKSSGKTVNCLVQATNDEGYLLFGSNQYGKGWLSKTDKNGLLIWEEAFADVSELTEVVQNKEGELFIIGMSNKKYTVFKTHSNGKKLIQIPFADNENSKAKAIGLAQDGKIVVVGYEKTGYNRQKGLIKWFNTEGVLIQVKAIENAVLMSLMTSAQGDLYVAGVSFSDKKDENMLMLRVQNEGTTIDKYEYGGTGTDVAFSLAQQTDGTIYLAGYSTKKRAARGGDICIVKTNNTGKNIWEEPLYLNKTSSTVNSIVSLPDGKIVVAAGEANSDAWIGQFSDIVLTKQEIIVQKQPEKPKPKPQITPIEPQYAKPESQTSKAETQNRLAVYWIGSPVHNAMTSKYQVHAFAVSTVPIPKDNFHYVINGKSPQSGAKFERVALMDSSFNGTEYTYNWRFDVPKNLGINKVVVEVSNALGEKRTQPVDVTYTSESNMTLHVLSIGVPSNLKFTTQDATDFAKIWESQKGLTFTDVKTTILNSYETTKQIPIAKAIEDLKNKFLSGEISKDDWIVVFLSSHGFTLSNDSTNFRIAASDYLERYESSTSLNFKDNIWDILKQIDCKKLIFIDACQSGAIVNRTMASAKGEDTEANKRLNEMIDKMMQTDANLWCVASSSGKQYSWEDATWQNGAFTEALIETFQNTEVPTVRGTTRADVNKDSILTFSEVVNFIRLRVPYLVETVKQQVQTPRLINSDLDIDFPIFYLKK